MNNSFYKPLSHFFPMAGEFKCLACGTCCRWPGPVLLDDDDIQTISKYLKVDSRCFLEKFTTLTDDRRGLTLTEQADGSCIFLQDNRCQIYEARPKQCRDFPHQWSFFGVEKECPGVRAAVGLGGQPS